MPDQPEAREGKTGLHGMAERPVLPRKPGNAGGGKGPWFKGDAGRGEGEEIGVSLRTPESVWKLQGALHAKAKGEPSYRFYSLYDKIHRKDVLLHAWNCCRANGGGAGVDGQSFEQIEAWGLEGWLGGLAEEIRKKTYRPQAVRRVWIPKPDGKQRPLGIPTIRDRLVQMAAVIILEPIFEADLAEEQYGYRPGRSAHGAVREIHGLLNRGYREVVDCDLSAYFDSIPHHELMKSIARRVSDGALLGLIKVWLEMSVEEDDGHGGKRRRSVAKDRGRGTPQGAPISPLLSNLYMRRFVLGWKQCGHEKRLKARVVVYADDFVILCRGTATRAKEQMQKIMTALKLTVNEKKTRIACARGVFRLPGLYDRAMSLDADGSSLHWHTAFPQVDEGHLRRDRRDDAESVLSETCSRSRWGNQPEAARLGKLLLPWSREPSVPGGGQSRPPSATPMVERQTPESGCSPHSLSGDLPARRVGLAPA